MNDADFPAAPSDDRLSSEELERVIRRAAQLQTARESLPDRLDDAEVLRIGAEVGLQEDNLRRAMLELRAGALVPEAPSDRSVATRLLGAAFIRASRVVPGEAEAVQSDLAGYLGADEGLIQVRNRAGLSIWEPASDLVTQIRRGLSLGRRYDLAKARRLEISVQQLEPGRCLVSVQADLRRKRAEHAGGWYTGAGVTTVGSTIVLVAAVGVPVLAAAPLAAGVAFGSGTLFARLTLGAEVERVELAVQGLLDRLERGTLGGRPARSGLMDRIEGLITEAGRSS